MDTIMAMQEAAPMAAAEPTERRAATFSLWDLGKRSLPAGEQPRITIKNQPWPAEFEYTLRPSRTPQGYLTAHATPPQTVDLPQGQALFLADGVLLGKRPFSLAGDEADLFFGSNPLVSGKMVLIVSQSGGKGIIGKKQTHLWAWTITATQPYPIPSPNPRRRTRASTRRQPHKNTTRIQPPTKAGRPYPDLAPDPGTPAKAKPSNTK